MIALIDGGLVAYPCAASCKEGDPVEVALNRVDELIRRILHDTGAEHYRIFVSEGRGNFRHLINPTYKANRKEQEPPVYLEQCKDYIRTEWKGESQYLYEDDDLLGIYQAEDTILCSYDKDLKLIPGKHYSWERYNSPAKFFNITYEEGIKHFYKQMLIGDSADNLQGIQGIGPKRAEKLIDPLETEQEMFDTVYNMYGDPDRFLMNACCFWILQKEGETWAHLVKSSQLIIPDELKLKVDQMLESMKSFIPTSI